MCVCVCMYIWYRNQTTGPISMKFGIRILLNGGKVCSRDSTPQPDPWGQGALNRVWHASATCSPISWLLVYFTIIGLFHPLNGITIPKYKFVSFLNNYFFAQKRALAFNWDWCCHLALCLLLILFHCLWNIKANLKYQVQSN